MKKTFSSVKDKMVSKYMDKDEPNKSKRPNINILLNRVRIDQKREKRNKLLFFASASLGLLIFGITVF